MLTWLAMVSLVGAVVAAGRWALWRTDGLGRPRPFPVISVALLVALGLGSVIPVVRHQRLERRLSDVASTLVGSEVVVDCQTRGAELIDLGSELGWVRYGPDGVPERRTLIKRAPCAHLRDYLGSDHEDPSRDEVVAVHVLSHEARHMVGVTVEAQAECGAMQRDALTARLLGAAPEQALALARRYWVEVYPLMRDEYRSAECAPGGAWDERRIEGPW